MKKLLFALLLACTLMLCLASCDKKKATTTRPIEYVKTSLREMEQEWYQNKARANDKYNGAYVMIYAIVREINGESFVVEESPLRTAHCTLAKQELRADLITLEKGD